MLLTDEEGDIEKTFAAFYEQHRNFGDELAAKDTFVAGWNAGRLWERAYHAAMAREMSGPHGEHGHPEDPAHRH